MSSALEIFDITQTIGISALLVITIPAACYVYVKLMIIRPFSENFTFKLIVLNGTTELLSCVLYLLIYQLTSFPYMAGVYTMLQSSRSVTPLTIIYSLLTAVSLHTSLFISLNRLKTIMFIRAQTNDSIFFITSLFLSLLFAIPPVVDYSIFTTLNYVSITFDNSTILIPGNKISNDALRTVTDIIRIVVSLATLVVNIVLCVLITRERAFIESSDRKKFNGEKGLVITSVVSYSFYMIYFVDMILARYSGIVICGFAQWLFLGLCSMTPFWCLMLFTPSVRRMAFKRKEESTAIAIPRQTISGLNSPIGTSPK